MTAGAAADTVCFPCVFSPSVSFADSSLVRGSHGVGGGMGGAQGDEDALLYGLLPPSLPLTREVAKPKVLTEGETDSSRRNNGCSPLSLRFLSLSQLR